MDNEFINPKSMMTPGGAGALLMFIVNGLCFSFPTLDPKVVALVLSFIIGTIVFKAVALRIFERCAYWVVNSLIIFVMGMGSANIASQVSYISAESEPTNRGVSLPFISEAVADDSRSIRELELQLEHERAQNERFRRELEQVKAKLREAEVRQIRPLRRPTAVLQAMPQREDSVDTARGRLEQEQRAQVERIEMEPEPPSVGLEEVLSEEVPQKNDKKFFRRW